MDVAVFAQLETDFHRELDLPRRSRLTCLKSRTRNLAKGRSSDDISGRAKVWMIEKIKKLSPKLHVKGFVDLGIFHDCEVRIIKTRSDNDIAAKATEARHRHEHRGIEPLLDAADPRDRPRYVGPERVADPIHRAVTGHDVDRTAALKLNDRSQLPALKELITAERQVVDSVEDESVARVKI